MSDHENPGSNSPEDGPFPEDHRPSQKSDDPISEEPGILVADLEYEAGSGSLLVDTTMDFKFRIPVNDGRYHKVHLNFHGADNYYRRITESAWLGGVWHSIRVEDLPESDLQVRVDGRWHYVDQWSRWTPRTLLVRKAARIASNRTVTTTVPGLAGKGSKITLVRPNSGTVLSTTTITNGYGNWTVTLLDSVPQGLQDFIIREEYGSTQGRYAGKASLTVLKPVTLTPLPQVISTQTPQFAGTGGLHQAMTRVDVYIKGTSIKVLADAKIEIDGSWGGISTYTFAFGENYSLVASQRYDGATSVPSVQRNFYVIDPPPNNVSWIDADGGHDIDVHRHCRRRDLQCCCCAFGKHPSSNQHPNRCRHRRMVCIFHADTWSAFNCRHAYLFGSDIADQPTLRHTGTHGQADGHIHASQ